MIKTQVTLVNSYYKKCNQVLNSANFPFWGKFIRIHQFILLTLYDWKEYDVVAKQKLFLQQLCCNHVMCASFEFLTFYMQLHLQKAF